MTKNYISLSNDVKISSFSIGRQIRIYVPMVGLTFTRLRLITGEKMVKLVKFLPFFKLNFVLLAVEMCLKPLIKDLSKSALLVRVSA